MTHEDRNDGHSKMIFRIILRLTIVTLLIGFGLGLLTGYLIFSR